MNESTYQLLMNKKKQIQRFENQLFSDIKNYVVKKHNQIYVWMISSESFKL